MPTKKASSGKWSPWLDTFSLISRGFLGSALFVLTLGGCALVGAVLYFGVPTLLMLLAVAIFAALLTVLTLGLILWHPQVTHLLFVKPFLVCLHVPQFMAQALMHRIPPAIVIAVVSFLIGVWIVTAIGNWMGIIQKPATQAAGAPPVDLEAAQQSALTSRRTPGGSDAPGLIILRKGKGTERPGEAPVAGLASDAGVLAVPASLA